MTDPTTPQSDFDLNWDDDWTAAACSLTNGDDCTACEG